MQANRISPLSPSSPLVRLRNYYRLFRPHSGRIKSLYFACRLTW